MSESGAKLSLLSRCYALSPLTPGLTGGAVALLLLLCYLASLLHFGAGSISSQDRLDGLVLSLLHIALVAYTSAACVMSERLWRVSQLRLQAIDGRVSDVASRDPWSRCCMLLAGLVGVAVSVSLTLQSPGEGTYYPEHWTVDIAWHRLLSPLIGFFIGRLSAAMVMDSLVLSGVARRLRRVSPINVAELHCLGSFGLHNALYLFCVCAIFSLFALNLEYLVTFISVFLLTLPIAVMAVVLPLLGGRSQIRAMKARELSCLVQAMERERSACEARGGYSVSPSLAALATWEQKVQRISDWPLEKTALVSFLAYVLIPVFSLALGSLLSVWFESLI